MKKLLLLAGICLFSFQLCSAQASRYVIFFKDKANSSYALSNPQNFLSQKAIQRRNRFSIAIDSTDLPINISYRQTIASIPGITVLNTSRWLNAVSISVSNSSSLSAILALPFVRSSRQIALRKNEQYQSPPLKNENQRIPAEQSRMQAASANLLQYGMSFEQIHIHNGEFLHNLGLQGQGITIGMLDAGFRNYRLIDSFDSLMLNNRVLSVYDFVSRDSSVNEDDSHGTECLSQIASNLPGQLVGTAPKSSFHLFRSEDDASEYPVEEFNWVCAAERVDSLGGDMISSSVGYSTFDSPLQGMNHNYSELDGNTTLAAIGADLAAKKGLLIITSAGNEGNTGWHFITTPADGDSVLAVGSVNLAGRPSSFSGFGPTADGRIKPDVASVGEGSIVAFPDNTIGGNSGTSFATPNLAGLAACLWQGFPEVNNMQIIDALRRSGNRASSPDDSIGYGVPDMKKAMSILTKETASASASVLHCLVNVQWISHDGTGMRYEIERRLQNETSFTKVATIVGGTSFALRSYQFTDPLNKVAAGPISYRIREILDSSGDGFLAIYLDTLTVTIPGDCGALGAVRAFPNPVADRLSVTVTTDEPVARVQFRIFDGIGKLVWIQNGSKPAGATYFEIPVLHLARGKYYLMVYTDDKLLGTSGLLKL